MTKEFILTQELKSAYFLMENTNENLFITGKAGTGKSSLINYFMKNTRKANVIVLAPTGIAAIKCNGKTLHSFFKLPPSIITPEILSNNNKFVSSSDRIMSSLNTIIIDEVSMVRADILDGIDYILRRNKNYNKLFGGVQMILIGDLYQLPPVVNNKANIDLIDVTDGKKKISEQEYLEETFGGIYFFNSKSYNAGNFKTLELNTIFRQNDNVYINILNSIRDGNINDETISILNQRCNKDFDLNTDIERIVLCGHNATVNEINKKQMYKLDTPEHIFNATMTGNYKEPSSELIFPAEEK